MESLCTYDRGTKAFEGRTYQADIDAHLDFQDRLWRQVKKAKKTLPRRIFCVGNHEQRIVKAINVQPELDGVIGLGDLKLNDFYDDIVFYNGASPGTILVDHISYAHFHISGIMGKAIGGEHPAASLIAKQHVSSVAGHSHLLDFSIRTDGTGRKLLGLVVGCYMDHFDAYAGNANKMRWPGICILRNVDNGVYNPQFVSLSTIRKEYA